LKDKKLNQREIARLHVAGQLLRRRRCMKEKNGEHPFGDAGQLISAGLFLCVWVLDSFFLRKSTFLSAYIPLYARLLFLAFALLCALYLSWSGHVVVRGPKRPGNVVATGAFRHVRHPLYLSGILIYLGLTVSTASLFSLALLVGVFVFYNYIADYEERLLDAKFGEGYMNYRKITGRWMPRICSRV
jgi:protein-S-isoprenylcysteine O-methyltransferase Ste14